MDLGLTMVNHRHYADLASRAGLSNRGNRLICMEHVIVRRTNRRAYVHPEVFKVVFGRRPPGYARGGSKMRYPQPNLRMAASAADSRRSDSA